MPDIHGRDPADLPAALTEARAKYGTGGVTGGVLPDGTWQVTITREAWMRWMYGAGDLWRSPPTPPSAKPSPPR